MIVDNFDQIRKHLLFDNEGDWFYHIQIIVRNKDEQNSGKKNSRVVKSFYVSSLEYLDRHEEDIKNFCRMYGGRAYIRLNPSSWKKCAFKGIGEWARILEESRFSAIRKVVDEMAGQYNADGIQKRWIVDIDTKDDRYINDVAETVCACPPEEPANKIIDVIPTKNGVHLLTSPFNLQEFRKTYPEKELAVQKNNPTLLYYEG